VTLPVDFERLVSSFARDLKLDGKTEKTVKIYVSAANELGEYLDTLPAEPVLDDAGAIIVPAAVKRAEDIRKEHIRGWIGYLRTRGSRQSGRRAGTPLTDSHINNRYRSLQPFFKWMVNEEFMDVSPMTNLEPPKVGKRVIPVIPEDVHRALLETCGKGRKRPFEDIRDEAILRFLGDTGCRVSEIVIPLADLFLHQNYARVTGKGNKQRDVPFGGRTAKALDFYLYARDEHRHASFSDLWLARKGPLSVSGVYQVVRRRGRLIGIPNLHPHQFRHTLAHEYRRKGGSETGLMRIMGWDSPTMAQRYGASAADERAREEHARLALGDRF
jgi:integrase/recombinase XerC